MDQRKFIGFLFILLLIPCMIQAFMINAMEDTSAFSTPGGNGVGTNVTVPGKVNNAMMLKYHFGTGDYVETYMTYQTLSLADATMLGFWYKGTGNANSIEVKLTDTSGNAKTYFLYGATAAPNWTQAAVPLSWFSNVSLSSINNLQFAVSKQPGDASGSGTLLIDKIFKYDNGIVASNMINRFNYLTATNCQFDTNGASTFFYSAGSDSISFTNSPLGRCALHLKRVDSKEVMAGYRYPSAPNTTGCNSIKFKLKVDAAGRKLGVALKDGNGKEIHSYVTGSSTNWIDVLVPFTRFPLIDFTSIKEIQFWMIGTRAGGEGEMNIPDPGKNITNYIDDLMFYRYVSSSNVIDEMESSPYNYSWSSGAGSSSSLNSVKLVDDGFDGKAIKLDYTLAGSQSYIYFNRGFYLNIYEGGGLRFYLKTTGDANNLEIKLKDKDGTVYVHKYSPFPITGTEWQQMSIGLDHDWAMVSSGANDDLDLRNIQNIYLTISKYKTGADGAVAFDELEGALVSGYQNTFQSGDIISSFNVDNIPFSPNGDGYNDTVTFDFKLNVKARVSVKIYSLSGFPIKEFPSAEYSPGSEVPITWDGLDLKNKVVKNGMYFFQLLAVSLDGKKQSVNYGLAVVK